MSDFLALFRYLSLKLDNMEFEMTCKNGTRIVVKRKDQVICSLSSMSPESCASLATEKLKEYRKEVLNE